MPLKRKKRKWGLSMRHVGCVALVKVSTKQHWVNKYSCWTANGSTRGCWWRQRGHYGVLLWVCATQLEPWTSEEIKDRSLMCRRDDSSTAVSSMPWGSLRCIRDFSVVWASSLKLCWDQRLWEALIRGANCDLPPGCCLSALCHLDPQRHCKL